MFSMCCLFFIFWVKLIVILGSAIQVLGLLWLFGDIYSSTLSFDCFVVLHLMCFLWVLGVFKPLLEFLGGNDDDQRVFVRCGTTFMLSYGYFAFKRKRKILCMILGFTSGGLFIF